jgi:hypothetical protein
MEVLAIIGSLLIGLGFAVDKIMGGGKEDRASGCFSGCLIFLCFIVILFIMFLGWVMQ